jgi:hypothetical protein
MGRSWKRAQPQGPAPRQFLTRQLGDPELPHQEGARHHALLDARWTRDAWAFLARLDPAAGERRATGRKNPDPLGAQLK